MPENAVDPSSSSTERISEEYENVTPFNPFRSRLSAAEDHNQPELPVNPEQELPGDDELDLDSELSPAPLNEVIEWPDTKPLPEEARRLLREVLAELRTRGTETFGPKDIPEEFKNNVRGRSWISPQLASMADAGELIEVKEGLYRFPPESGTPGIADAA